MYRSLAHYQSVDPTRNPVHYGGKVQTMRTVYVCVCACVSVCMCLCEAGVGGVQHWSVAGEVALLRRDYWAPRVLLLDIHSLVLSTPNISHSELPQPRESGGGKCHFSFPLTSSRRNRAQFSERLIIK